MSDFGACDAFVAAREGGYQDNPADPGNYVAGALVGTNRGISAPVLAAWRGTPVTRGMMRALTAAEASAIRAALYWAPITGDQLPAGLDLLVYDDAVNRGVATAAKLAQLSAGVTPDGIIGPISLGAFAKSPLSIAGRMVPRQFADYAQDDGFGTFGIGWFRRVALRVDAAMRMMEG